MTILTVTKMGHMGSNRKIRPCDVQLVDNSHFYETVILMVA